MLQTPFKLRLMFACLLSSSLVTGCGTGSDFSSDTKKDEARAQEQEDQKQEQTPGSSTPSSGPTSSGSVDASKAPSSVNLKDPGKPGPYQVQSYSDNFLIDAGYQSARVYYPSDAPMTMTLPGTSLSGGFTNTKEDMAWLGQHLASHGFIVLAFTPTNNRSLDPNIWATGHKASLVVLKAENLRTGSPINNRLKADKLGIMGFSMGGAGTIVAVNQLGAEGVQAAVPICAFQPQLPTAKVPMMLITGTADTIASPINIRNAYTNMSTGASKGIASFNGMTHLDVTQTGPLDQHENIARFATSWYLVHLDAQGAYKTYLDGDENKKITSDMAVFAMSTDYMFQP